MENYIQLAGALSALKEDGAELDWAEIVPQVISLGAKIGIAIYGNPLSPEGQINWKDPVHGIILELSRKYRGICLDRGIILPGELFDWRDIRAIEYFKATTEDGKC